MIVQGPDHEAATNIARQLASGQAKLANLGGKQVLLITNPQQQAKAATATDGQQQQQQQQPAAQPTVQPQTTQPQQPQTTSQLPRYADLISQSYALQFFGTFTDLHFCNSTLRKFILMWMRSLSMHCISDRWNISNYIIM